jgi:endonuclease III
MKSRYTNCNQAKLEQIVRNPTGFLTKKCQKLIKIAQFWRSLTGSNIEQSFFLQ